MSGLAYHLVVNAMEGRAGWTPIARFSSAVARSINGHLPYHRYHTAGRARKQEGIGLGVIERLTRDWLATDLNPAVQLVRSLRQPSNALRAYNTYNASAQLGVRTNVAALRPDNAGNSPIVAKRDLLATVDDPEQCRLGTIIVADSLFGMVQRNAKARLAPEPFSLLDIARYLGVESSAAAEVAWVFGSKGHIPIALVAQELGCHQRTLERRLREEGLTAESLRQSSRLIRVMGRLRSMESLTNIAIDEGFSDQAHMTRAFQTSCGMPPSVIRRLVRETNEPEITISTHDMSRA